MMEKKLAQTVFLLFIFITAFAPALTARSKPAKRGPRDLASGVIKNVRCKGARLDMDFQTSREMLHLFTDNYFGVEFTAQNFTPSGKMDPCRQTTGMHARIVFYDIQGHPDKGELISVELRK